MPVIIDGTSGITTPSYTLEANSVVSVGNSTVNTAITSDTISIGNSSVNTIIHSTGITANGANIHSVNAATVGGNTASDLRSYSSNASNISLGTLDTARLPATANIATAVNIGANVSFTTSSIRIGNTTVNSNHVDVASGGSYRIGNTAILNYSTASDGSSSWLITVRPTAVGTSDLRIPQPNQFLNGRISPLFTSMNLNNGSPYGDAIHFSTYGDHTGGSPNIFVINKSSNEVKISRGSYDSGTPYYSGSIYTLDYTSASDSSVKEDVHDITNGLEVITNLRPVTYKWTDEYILAGFSKNRQENNVDEEGRIVLPNEKAINVGLIAQEVQEVLPTVVHNDNVSLPGTEEFLLNVSYEKIVPHLIAAIKEQQQQIDLLKAQVQALQG